MTAMMLCCTAFVGWAWIVALDRWGPARRDTYWLPIAGLVAAHAHVVVVVLALGLSHALTRTSVIASVVVPAAAVVVTFVVRDGPRAFFDDERARWRRRYRALLRAIGEADGLLTIVPLAMGAAMFLYFFAAAFVSPTAGQGDSVFYHEPIVALSLQHGHIGPFDLPSALQRVNGMPRFCNFIQLWFAAFTGRGHTEFANILAAPFGFVAVAGSMRRVGASRGDAWRLALCFSLMPGLLRLSDGVLVDPLSTTWFACALYLVTGPLHRTVMSASASVVVALTVGTKYHLIVISFVLSAVLVVRLLRVGRWPRRVLSAVLASALILAAVASHYGRNYVDFENPVWPAGMTIERFDLTFKAANRKSLKNGLTSGREIEDDEVKDRMWAAPWTRSPWAGAGARPEDFGPLVRFVMIPLGKVAVLFGIAALGLVIVRRRRWPKSAWIVLVSLLSLYLSFKFFPAIIRGRYWLPVVPMFMSLSIWLLVRLKIERAIAALSLGGVLASALAVVWLHDAGEFLSPTNVLTRLEADPVERAWVGRRGSRIYEQTGRARAVELTRGKRVVFSYVQALGMLWNDDYSNQVIWMGDVKGDARMPRVDALKADWLYLHKDKGATFGVDPEQWTWVGKLHKRRKRTPGRVYRRIVRSADQQ